MKNKLKFIDLFAGMGGTRVGFEEACRKNKITPSCVFTSEIKQFAVETYQANFNNEFIHGDITKIDPKDIPDFDYLLGGFPCQPFSTAGKGEGLKDRRGNLFFVLLDILKEKKPSGFLLENVEGLVTNDGGRTLQIILQSLESIGYKTTYKVLNAIDFGVPQARKRVYIVGHRIKSVNLDSFGVKRKTVGGCVNQNYAFKPTIFAKKLMAHYSLDDLNGKGIGDKRGGDNNIHSWDISHKGKVSASQKLLLTQLLTKRRYKRWAIEKNVEWYDGRPLTLKDISTFHPSKNLKEELHDLVDKGYLVFEYPKKRTKQSGYREYDLTQPKGYNLVAGKLSFEISKVLDKDGFAPTIVATEVGKIAVATTKGVRPITIGEGLLLSGFPEAYKINSNEYRKSWDLLGNTVMPPVITAVAQRLIAVG